MNRRSTTATAVTPRPARPMTRVTDPSRSSPTRQRWAWLATTAAAVGGVVIASPLLVVGPWLGLVAWQRWNRVESAEATRRRELVDLPPYLDALAQRLGSGGSLSQAVRETPVPASLTERLQPLRWGLSFGLGLQASLGLLRSRLAADPEHPPAFDLLVDTIDVLVLRGGPTLPSLERLNDTIRSAEWVEAEVRLQAGQATASAVVLTGLPLLFAGGLAALDHRLARFYLYDPVGAACLLTAGVLAYGGWRWMAQLVRPPRPNRRRRHPIPRLRRGRPSAAEALPAAIDLCVVILSAGGTIRDCIEAIAGHGPRPAQAAAEDAVARLQHGHRLEQALRWLQAELGPGFQPLTGVLLLAREQGGGIGELLTRLSVEASASRRRAGELRARQLPVALLLPLVTCSLPAVIVGAVVPLAVVAIAGVDL